MPSSSQFQTQGIKYAGSKLKLIPQIIDCIKDLEIKTVLDGFSGSTRVSQAMAQLGYDVSSNDVSVWSKTFAECYLFHDQPKKYYQDIIDHLNNIAPVYGWFSEHYGGDENLSIKKPFQLKNTMKLDAIREEIEHLNLNSIDKSVILTCLILAMDKVDSTLGHYVSYLSKWSPRSFNDMVLEVPLLVKTEGEHHVYQSDIFETIKGKSYDLAYFDPPYGSNNDKMPPSRVRYNSYYHIWTSVIQNDKPALFGKVSRREDSKDTNTSSVFEEFRKDENGNFFAMKALEGLINQTKSRYILLSYSSGGRATKESLYNIIEHCGKLIKSIEIDYKQNVMSNMRWTNDWINSDGKHKEYLLLIEKD
jgi:adenine-specific DNA-methyltransferase